MSGKKELNPVEPSSKTNLTKVRRETETQIRQILVQAAHKATARQEAARQALLQQAAGRRAFRLHQASLEATQITSAAYKEVLQEIIDEASQQLMTIREEPASGVFYRHLLQRLTEEAIVSLGSREIEETAMASGNLPQLLIDPRDEALMAEIAQELGLNVPIRPELDVWGGVVVRSGNGRLIIDNTLEARLEQAMPYLRQQLAAFFEAAIKAEAEETSASTVHHDE